MLVSVAVGQSRTLLSIVSLPILTAKNLEAGDGCEMRGVLQRLPDNSHDR